MSDRKEFIEQELKERRDLWNRWTGRISWAITEASCELCDELYPDAHTDEDAQGEICDIIEKILLEKLSE